MIGSGDPTPFDGYAFVALCLMAALLLLGFVIGPKWTASSATWMRWGALIVSVILLAVVLLLTPTTSGIVGAGRMLSLYPAAAAVVILFLAWSWRIGHF
ncbi:MAG: hypothetical protein ABI877_04610 [Gemmatimonadaceae bacterium]